MNTTTHTHQLVMPLDTTPQAPTVERHPLLSVERLLPGDTHHGRDLFESAQAWTGDAASTAFVRAESRGGLTLLSVCRYVGDGEGELVSGVLGAGDDECVARRLRAALLRATDVVLVGHAIEAVSPLLEFGARIVARRSMFAVRALELGLFNAMRDEAWMTATGRRGGDLSDPVERGWLVERAHADLCSLIVSRGETPSLH